MNYKTYLPPESLKHYVRCFWSLESSDGNEAQQTLRTIADGSPGLIFQHSDFGSYLQGEKKLPETFLYGQSTTFGHLSLNGNFSSTGVFFYPGAVKELFGINSYELTDTCLDLDAEAKKKGFYLSEQLSEAASASERIGVLSAYLFFQAQANALHKNEVISYIVSAIVRSGGTITLKEVQEKVQLSERTFERRFSEYVGISPKLFSRICRFQASLEKLRNGDYEKLSDIAFENDYADQSHFIRTFREFTGFSPNEFTTRSNEIAENLAQLKK